MFDDKLLTFEDFSIINKMKCPKQSCIYLDKKIKKNVTKSINLEENKTFQSFDTDEQLLVESVFKESDVNCILIN